MNSITIKIHITLKGFPSLLIVFRLKNGRMFWTMDVVEGLMVGREESFRKDYQRYELRRFIYSYCRRTYFMRYVYCYSILARS
jgi:hypothetical protein